MHKIVLVVFLGTVALATAQEGYFEEEVEAWHFHTYFFEVNPSKTAEAIAFRKALREQIDNGTMAECSLNEIRIGWAGPHPVSQWECCCNKSSFAPSHSFHTQNHGNLSVLLHPLTIYDREDHVGRASWLGKEVVLNADVLYPLLPKARPCPVYPRYSDDLPTNLKNLEYSMPIRGTEDYWNLDRSFNILEDEY